MHLWFVLRITFLLVLLVTFSDPPGGEGELMRLQCETVNRLGEAEGCCEHTIPHTHVSRPGERRTMSAERPERLPAWGWAHDVYMYFFGRIAAEEIFRDGILCTFMTMQRAREI